MKKFILVFFITLLTLISFIGCSTKQKSEEALKEELRAELEAEKENDQSMVPKEDMKDDVESSSAKEDDDSMISKGKDDVKSSSKNQGSTNQSASEKGTLYLSDLKNGDFIGGGLTIRDINYTKGGDKVSFALYGDTVLTGKLFFDEMSDDIHLLVTDPESIPNTIYIEGYRPDVYIEYKPRFVRFRNNDILLNEISKGEQNKIKKGESLGVKLRIKNMDFSAQFESEGGTSCEFVEIIEINSDTDANVNSDIDSSLIEDDEENGYYKYKANATISFDLDSDGTKEKIKFDSVNGKLNVSGYESIKIDTFSVEKNYFIIINFKDRFNTEMNMIGIIDYGPSSDPTTSLYSITEPRGEKYFGSVGQVQGEIVTLDKYNDDNMDDFNYKAILLKGEGIEAPVRLSMGIQTWFGRNLFTYYTTYTNLVDNNEKYGQDYITKSELMVEKDVIAYSKKDINSKRYNIKAGQKVQLVATDNKEWIQMVTKDGDGGWVKVNYVNQSNFSGFAFFD